MRCGAIATAALASDDNTGVCVTTLARPGAREASRAHQVNQPERVGGRGRSRPRSNATRNSAL